MKNIIINTPMVKVIQSAIGYEMQITCKDGTVVEHEPFPNNLEGMVAAISLSAEICAGKFYLRGVFKLKNELKTIEYNQGGTIGTKGSNSKRT